MTTTLTLDQITQSGTKTMKRKSRNQFAAKTALIDILNACQRYQSTSHNITEKIIALRKRFNLPSYAWSFLDGYAQCKRDGWMSNHVHLYVAPDGHFIDAHKWSELPESDLEILRGSKSIASGFWWRNKDGSIGRPYFVTIAIGDGSKYGTFAVVTDSFIGGFKPISESDLVA